MRAASCTRRCIPTTRPPFVTTELSDWDFAVETSDYRFVAPDNGVLTAVFQETPPKRIVELTERRYFRPTVSRTFEGRDRFAPAAAWLTAPISTSFATRPCG